MRGLTRTAAGLAAIAISAGVLAGCGSSSDTASSVADTATSAVESVASDVATSTTAAVTKAQYVAEVNKICTKIDDTADALDNTDVDSAAAAKAAIAKLTANAKLGVEQLKRVTPPADLQAAHDALVSTSSQSIALSVALFKGFAGGKQPTKAQLEADAAKAEVLVKKQTAAAKELGLSNCFSGVNDDGDLATNDDGDGSDAG